MHWLDYVLPLTLPLMWLAAPFRRQPQRPLSPAPERSQFETDDAFQVEQARWFRDHGNGTELQGSRREQNTLFWRLQDRLFGLRRDRANPSGTQRAATASARAVLPSHATSAASFIAASVCSDAAGAAAEMATAGCEALVPALGALRELGRSPCSVIEGAREAVAPPSRPDLRPWRAAERSLGSFC